MPTVALKAPAVWAHSLDTFGTEERAARWMRMPTEEIGNRTAEEVLVNTLPDGEKAVEAILARIDYGVCS